jgi:hypothetical protein
MAFRGARRANPRRLRVEATKKTSGSSRIKRKETTMTSVEKKTCAYSPDSIAP